MKVRLGYPAWEASCFSAPKVISSEFSRCDVGIAPYDLLEKCTFRRGRCPLSRVTWYTKV